jgi:leucyl aminopeptidase (aminopeptidase T)
MIRLEEIARDSTIIISMPQFSATAPLLMLTRKYENLRVASMPTVSKAMEETALSANYNQIARTCAQLAALFDQSDGIHVTFSTGHSCYFDKSDRKPARQDNGRLHPGETNFRLRNLPSGEVFVVPNESSESKTRGEIPVSYGDETAVFVVQGNRIVDVRGDGPMAAQKRQEFRAEKALGNIAEVAIGCNDKALVTGNVLEDEKAGFHWAYGRSEFLGGTVSPKDFSAPDKVLHQDIVYAKGNPIVCERFDFILSDASRKTAIVDGVLQIES